jgi:hypothetical protein
LLLFIASIGLSWCAVKIQEADRQRKAVETIRASGGWVTYEDGLLSSRLGKMFGEDYFAHIEGVKVLGEADLECLKDLPRLHKVNLDGARVSNEALRHLEGLNRLQWLSLANTHVGDEGLEHIKDLIELRDVKLNNTKVTDAGLGKLVGLRRLWRLELDDTQVTDNGLDHLKEMHSLSHLRVARTHITVEGIVGLRRALKNDSFLIGEGVDR